MEILTTITARDYSNLRQTYSEKNIINQTTGTEYVIDVAKATPITDTLGRPTDFNITPLDGGTKAKVWASKKELAPFTEALIFEGTSAREEYYSVVDTFSIQPDQVIDDINTLSIKLTIDYDKYVAEGQLVNDTNFDNADTSVFYSIMTEENKENKDGYLTAEMQMPFEHSKFIRPPTYNLSANFPLSYIWPSIGKTEDGNYQLTLKHETVTYWGYNVIESVLLPGLKFSTKHTNTLLVARVLHFKLSANTVTERSLDFNYTRTLNDNQLTIGKTYEMGTNEFLQTEELADVQTRQSYQLSQEIFNKFDTDRPLISFLLLNCEKYLIGGNYRYLRAEDLIYIKDENDEYIGTETTEDGDLIAGVFEVIKTRPVWAGSYQMEVTCRQIDMTK